MKNLKKMMAFGILMGGLTANSTFAGIMINDAAKPAPCVQGDGIMINDAAGIIISDAAGIIISDFAGLIISDLVKSDDCAVTDGIMIND